MTHLVIWSLSQLRKCDSLEDYGIYLLQLLLSYWVEVFALMVCILKVWLLLVCSRSVVWLFATSWTEAHQATLSFIISRNLLKLMSTESVMPPNHLILCHSLLLLPSIFLTIRVFSNESALHIRWPKYWNFSFSISPSNEYSGLISFRIDWFDLLEVQGTLKSLLQYHSSKASILWLSAFFMVQLSHPYMSTGKTVTDYTDLCWHSKKLKVAWSCLTLCDSPWNFPGKNAGVGCCSLLQGIFSTQGLKPGLPHYRMILYQVSHQGSPWTLEWLAYPFFSWSSQPRNRTGVSCIAGGFFTSWATREVQSNELQGSLAGCSPWGHKESDTTEWLNQTELLWEFMNIIISLYA